MKFLCCILGLLGLFLVSEGARRVNVQERVKRNLRSIKREDGSHPPLEELLALAPDEKLRLKTFTVPGSGLRLNRFEETYKGLPVFGTVVTEKEDPRTGDISEGIRGKIYEGIEDDLPDVIPDLTETDAFMIAMKNEGHLQAKNLNFRSFKIHLIVKVNRDNLAELVFYLSYVTEGDIIKNYLSKPTYFINAKTGAIIQRWEGIRTNAWLVDGEGGNTKTGRINYTGSKKLKVKKRQQVCYMENQYVAVYDMQGTTTHPASTLQTSCSQGPDDEVNGAYSPASDALYYIEQAVKMFKEYNLFNFDKMHVQVHYGQNYANAAWDGTYISFGDGDQLFHPMVSLDLCAHELAHAFTEQFSNLIYIEQSGAINEAFSDMAGEAAEFYVHGSNDWIVGEHLLKSYHGEGIRFMQDPMNDSYSIDHASQYHDQLDVHYSSGVYNKAFYTLATTSGWDTETAFKVFALANKMYWTDDVNFDQAACDVESAALDENMPASDVTNAFNVVGVTCS